MLKTLTRKSIFFNIPTYQFHIQLNDEQSLNSNEDKRVYTLIHTKQTNYRVFPSRQNQPFTQLTNAHIKNNGNTAVWKTKMTIKSIVLRVALSAAT